MKEVYFGEVRCRLSGLVRGNAQRRLSSPMRDITWDIYALIIHYCYITVSLKIRFENIQIVPWTTRLRQPKSHPSIYPSHPSTETDGIESECASHTPGKQPRAHHCNGSPDKAQSVFSSVGYDCHTPFSASLRSKERCAAALSKRRWDCEIMAEAELQTFTSIMDSLVRIGVSMTFNSLRNLFQPCVLRHDTPASVICCPHTSNHTVHHAHILSVHFKTHMR